MAPTGPSVNDRHGAVVYNPTKVDLARLRRSVDSAAAAAGWGETLWFSTSPTDAGQQAARHALHQGASVVLAAGGDGTVRAVAEVLRDSEVSLAIVPSGTGNLLARNMQLPLGSIDDSTAIAFGGIDKPIDLGVASVTTEGGETDDHVFLVMAGLGIDAQMIANTRPDLKRQVGWLAYVHAGVRAIPRAKPFRIRYSLSGSPDLEDQADPNPKLQALAGGMEILPPAPPRRAAGAGPRASGEGRGGLGREIAGGGRGGRGVGGLRRGGGGRFRPPRPRTSAP